MKHDVVVIGASGHAKVVIEIFRASGVSVAFCVGNDVGSGFCIGVPILVGDHHIHRLKQEGYINAFVAIGLNQLRQRLADRLKDEGFNLLNALSPHAVVSPTAKLGCGIAVMAGAVVNADAVIADLAIVNTGATIDHDCNIGYASHIGPQSALAGDVTVGAYSFLGVGSKVIPGISIGERVIVGAGGVVINDIGDDETVVGIPAEPKNFLNKSMKDKK